jgi:ubiquinone/menaquinone biosynthesis C-methylase UbiE
MRKLTKTLLLAAIPAAGLSLAGAYAYAEYRKERLQREAARLWDLLALRPGSRVVELGAGGGDLTALLASRVGPAGRIFATEVDEGKLRKLAKRKQKAGWSNVEVLACGPGGCDLPERGCDAVYMRGVYHHLTDPDAMDASLYRALRRGGTLAVIDFPPRLLLSLCTPRGIPANRGGHGIRHGLVTEELQRAGFDAVRTVPDWPGGYYCVLFQKPIAA